MPGDCSRIEVVTRESCFEPDYFFNLKRIVGRVTKEYEIADNPGQDKIFRGRSSILGQLPGEILWFVSYWLLHGSECWQ